MLHGAIAFRQKMEKTKARRADGSKRYVTASALGGTLSPPFRQ